MSAVAQGAHQLPTVVQGRIERFLAGPKPDGFAIARIKTRSGSLTIKARSALANFAIGDAIEISGHESVHPRFGKQIDATAAKVADQSLDGLATWFAQAGFEGIGAKRASDIAETLGSDAIVRIKAGEPSAREALGKRYSQVRKAICDNFEEAKAGIVLAGFGVGKETRDKIFKAFGPETGDIIENDPYRLISEVNGVAFTTADNIARAAGMSTDSEPRIIAAAIDTLANASKDGKTWLPMSEVIAGATERTGLKLRAVARCIDAAAPADIRLVTVGKGEDQRRGWALDKIASREEAIARMVKAKLRQPKRYNRLAAADLVSKHSSAIGIVLNERQFEAAVMAIVEPFAIITGFPGTGKTTVLQVITRCWKDLGREMKLASPTGKAAQRMNEATKIEAETIHRLLGVEEGHFVHGAQNPIEADSIAIDEASMLDVFLCCSLLNATMASQMLLIGDADQLLSVDPGRVFGDMVDVDAIPTIRLTEVRRQAKGSAIATGAEAIRRGEMPEWGGDLEFLEINDPAEVAKTVAALHAGFASAGYSVQVLTPGHGSETGTSALNGSLAPAFEEDEPAAIVAGGLVRVGDKVIQTRNDAERNVFNGDSGRVVSVSETGKSVTVLFSGAKDIELSFSGRQLADITPAWALTVHKAQGSEYDVVILPMTTSHWTLLRRNMLNTGVTRAKTHCVVVGQTRAIHQALSRDDNSERLSRLADLLA